MPHAVGFIETGVCDVALGKTASARGPTRWRAGCRLYKYVANRLLTLVKNVALGQNLGDFHSGFWAYRREVLETISFERNSDDFVFDSQLLAQAVHFGFRLGDVPVRYFEEASSIRFRGALRYGVGTLGAVGAFWSHRLGLRHSPLFRSREGEASGSSP